MQYLSFVEQKAALNMLLKKGGVLRGMSPRSMANADLPDRSGYLPDLFYSSPNTLGLFAFPKEHHVLRCGADIFKSSLTKLASFFGLGFELKIYDVHILGAYVCNSC
jgi:hypothetical protein